MHNLHKNCSTYRDELLDLVGLGLTTGVITLVVETEDHLVQHAEIISESTHIFSTIRTYMFVSLRKHVDFIIYFPLFGR